MPPTQSIVPKEPTSNVAPTSQIPLQERSDSSFVQPQAPLPPNVDPAEAKKIERMKSKIAALEAQIRETEEKQREVASKLKTDDPAATAKAHIKLLHDYNEIRDIGQGLMGIIADNRGVRVSEVYRDFDLGEGD